MVVPATLISFISVSIITTSRIPPSRTIKLLALPNTNHESPCSRQYATISSTSFFVLGKANTSAGPPVLVKVTFFNGSSTNKVISFNVSNIALVFTKVSPFFSKYLSYSSMIERKLLVLFKEHAVVVGVAFLHITHDFHRLFLALTLALAVFEWPE